MKRGLVEVVGIEIPSLCHLDRSVEMVSVVFMVEISGMGFYKGNSEGKGDKDTQSYPEESCARLRGHTPRCLSSFKYVLSGKSHLGHLSELVVRGPIPKGNGNFSGETATRQVKELVVRYSVYSLQRARIDTEQRRG
jgi:hypothetical protein